MSDYAPQEAAAFPTALDTFFPPEKERIDAPEPAVPKHEFEVEDRRYTDWPRRRAIVIDNLILLAVFWFLAKPLHGYIGAGLFAAALGLSYFFVAEATAGQTIGKRLMGLRVVMRDGRPAPANAVAARTVFRLIDALPFAWMFGGLSMLLTGGRRQRIGDLVAGTCVRRNDRAMPKPPHSPLLAVYPIVWIGMALALVWGANLLQQHIDVPGHLTADTYMRKVDSVCERHLLTVAKAHAAGTQVGFQEALHNAELEYGAIASLPAPPPKSREAYRTVMRHERTVVRRFHRIRPRVEWSLDPKKTIGKELRGLLMIEKDAGRSFKQIGLPHCVLSRPHA